MSKIKKILVSQPRPDNEKSPYFAIAEKYGVDIVFRPFIKVEGVSAKEFRQQSIYRGVHCDNIYSTYCNRSLLQTML